MLELETTGTFSDSFNERTTVLDPALKLHVACLSTSFTLGLEVRALTLALCFLGKVQGFRRVGVVCTRYTETPGLRAHAWVPA